jgi:hypothetical protein
LYKSAAKFTKPGIAGHRLPDYRSLGVNAGLRGPQCGARAGAALAREAWNNL